MTRKTFTVLFIAFLIFLLIVPFVSYKAFKSAIKEEAFNHLVTARDILRFQIWNYFEQRFGDVHVLSRNPVIIQGFSRLSGALRTQGIKSREFRRITNRYQTLMEYYIIDYGYVNIYFIDKDGNVIYSTLRGEYYGTNLYTGPEKESRFAHIFMRGLEDIVFEDYLWYERAKDYVSYYATPVYESENLLGVLITALPFSHLNTMLTERTGLGQTGEMYLVGADGLMRSNSRFSEQPTMLQLEVDTEATRDAHEGNTGTKIIRDYRGVPVLSAYTPLNLDFVKWALLVEIDVAEAFEPIHIVESRLIMIGSTICGIAIGYLYLSYRRGKKRKIPEEAGSKT